MKDEIRYTLEQNLERVENLVKTYESHPDAQGQGRKKVQVLDILRSATVLLHASLEDVLRDLARWKLPEASKQTLNDIPLLGLGHNPKKFFLGELVAFREKAVAEVLADSVDAHLENSNFNNTDDIASLLNGIGLDVTKVSDTFSGLKPLMERRHQIVHRADRQRQVVGSGDHHVRAINKDTVREWAAAVRDFADKLFAEL